MPRSGAAARGNRDPRTRRRGAAAVCVVSGLLALGIAFGAEWYGGLVPCALCLVERWPYRATIALGLIGVLLPRSFGRVAVWLSALAMVTAAALAAVHVGVEQGWWPSPLPECAAPSFSGGSIAERLAAMPAHPSKPCDDPSYLIPGLPVSMAQMNLAYALAAFGIMAAMLRRAR